MPWFKLKLFLHLAALAGMLGFFYSQLIISSDGDPNLALDLFSKPLPVYACIALIWVRGYRNSKTYIQLNKLLMSLALFASSLGDIFLAIHHHNRHHHERQQLQKLIARGEVDFFLLGLVAFLVAHIFYIICFSVEGRAIPKQLEQRPTSDQQEQEQQQQQQQPYHHDFLCVRTGINFGLRKLHLLLPFLIYAVALVSLLKKQVSPELLTPIAVYTIVLSAFGWRMTARFSEPTLKPADPILNQLVTTATAKKATTTCDSNNVDDRSNRNSNNNNNNNKNKNISIHIRLSQKLSSMDSNTAISLYQLVRVVGAISFLCSDTMIAVNMFLSRNIGKVESTLFIMGTYYLAQYLLSFSVCEYPLTFEDTVKKISMVSSKGGGGGGTTPATTTSAVEEEQCRTTTAEVNNRTEEGNKTTATTTTTTTG